MRRSHWATYQVDAAARPYLTSERVAALAGAVATFAVDFKLPDRMHWPAARLLFRYIGRLERREAGQAFGSLLGGEYRGPDRDYEVLEYPDAFTKTYTHRQALLAAAACVSIAAKFWELQVPDLRQLRECIEPKVEVSELCAAETSVLTALQWDVASPTPHQLVECFLRERGEAVPPDTLAFEEMTNLWAIAYWACDATAYIRELVFEPVRMHAATSLEYLRRHNAAARALYTPGLLARAFEVPKTPMFDRADELAALYAMHHEHKEKRQPNGSG